jgi:phage-related protein
VFVLHTFQKKSKHGIATLQSEMHLINRRLKLAMEMVDAKE